MNSTIQKIQRYIDRTGITPVSKGRYQMALSELMALKERADGNCTGALCLAFEYGLAKGYRAAKVEKEART